MAVRAASAARRLLVLTYHRVLERPDPLRPDEMTVTAFERQMRVLRRWFDVLPLQEAWERTCNGTLPRRAVAITFDDGYADNCELALPVLARHGLTATFFVATAFLDGGRMWNDTIIETLRAAPPRLDLRDLDAGVLELHDFAARRTAAAALIRAWKHLAPAERAGRVEGLVERAGVRPPTDLMMRSSQVRELARAGMTIGAHTLTHPILLKIADADAEREMRGSKAALEALIGGRVGLFAYPNGRLGDDYDLRHAQIARAAGFALAVSTDPGSAGPDSDPFRLPRFGPWPEAPWRFGLRLLSLY